MNIAIVAPGEMGSAMAGEFRLKGARVLTSLAGRSPASARRAQEAGFEAAPDDDCLVAEADFLLSVVPPGRALELAQRFAPALARAERKPVYVDCNAVAPATVRRVADALAGSGCEVVDAALFGGPTSGKPGVVIYVSGPAAGNAMRLGDYGPKLRLVDGPVGAASALKLSFAGLNKGFTALGAAMLLAAQKSGSAGALAEQLAESQPAILAYVSRFVPAMFPKAYRWEPEMHEIAAFLEEDEAAREIFQAMARIYGRIAREVAAGDPTIEALAQFCRHNAVESHK